MLVGSSKGTSLARKPPFAGASNRPGGRQLGTSSRPFGVHYLSLLGDVLDILENVIDLI